MMQGDIQVSGIESVWQGRMILGEGPLWHADEGCLYFVDIKSNRLYRLDPKSGDTRTWDFEEAIGCVVPSDKPGFLKAAFRTGTGEIDLATGKRTLTFIPERLAPEQRFNDGKLDPHDGFWAGTMDNAETADIGVFYRIMPDGTASVIDDGYGVTNGPAFAPDGKTVYMTDSKARTIFRVSYDFAAGRVIEKSVFAKLEGDEGYPDGMACTPDGSLWVACWDGWRVMRFRPDGSRDGFVRLPVQRPTSLAFGPGFTHLFVTSATVGLSDDALAAQPLSGGVLRVDL